MYPIVENAGLAKMSNECIIETAKLAINAIYENKKKVNAFDAAKIAGIITGENGYIEKVAIWEEVYSNCITILKERNDSEKSLRDVGMAVSTSKI
jgi:hypothetical protein